MALLLQIGELFNGNFNWRGLFQLLLFVVMAFIVIAFSVVIGYKAFSSKKKNDN